MRKPTDPTPADRRKQRRIKIAASLCLLFLLLTGLVTDRWLQQYEFQLASVTLKSQLNQIKLQSISSLQQLASSGSLDSISAEDVLARLETDLPVNDVRVVFDDGTFRQLNRGNPMHQYRVTADDTDAASAPLQMSGSLYWQAYFQAGREQKPLIWPAEQQLSEFVLSIFLPQSGILFLLDLSWADLIPEYPLATLAVQFKDQPAINLAGAAVTDTLPATRVLTERWRSIARKPTPFWTILIPLIGLGLIGPILYLMRHRPTTMTPNSAVTHSKMLNHLCNEFNLLLLVTDRKGTVLWRKGTLARDIPLSGVRKGESVRRTLNQQPRCLAYLQQTLNGNRLSYEMELENHTLRIVQWPNRDRNQQIHGMTFFAYDISGQRQQEGQWRHEDQHDKLTGLPGPQLYTEQLSHELHRSRRRHENLAVIALGLSGIHKLKERFGSARSDQLLQAIARGIHRILRDEDSRCRYSNNEFLISVSDYQHPDNLYELARRLLQVATEWYSIDSQELSLQANAGIATFPHDARDVGSLINNAIVAMRHARETGRNTLDYFSDDAAQQAKEKRRLKHDISNAMAKRDFEVYYQPIFDLQSNYCIGAEALIRWPDGHVEPDDFIPLAEETGLIHDMGFWALETAMQQLTYWQGLPVQMEYLCVNISTLQLQQDDFLPRVASLVERFALPPGSIVLDLTESMVMQTTPAAIATLQQLQKLGFRLAIDDFGTGYSALNHLRHLQVNFLKIDKSFIDGIPENLQDSAICRAIFSAADALNIDVIAEGVETQEQLAWLMENGVSAAQGYFYARALPADEFLQYLQPR